MLNHDKSEPIFDLTKLKVLILAPPKFGKSTFASTFPGAYFVCTERGHNALSINKTDIHTWNEMRQFIGSIIKDAEGFKTFVFDTADRTYDLCCEDVVHNYNNPIGTDGLPCGKPKVLVKSIIQMPFGQGAQAKDQFFAMLRQLERVEAGIVFISHLVEENGKVKPDSGKYTCSLPEKVRPAFFAWFDIILKIDIDEIPDENGNTVMQRSIVAYTDTTSNTGSRFPISGRLPLDWNALNAEIMRSKAAYEKNKSTTAPKPEPKTAQTAQPKKDKKEETNNG